MAESSWANAPEYSGGDPVPGTGETTVAQYRKQHAWYQDNGVEGVPGGTDLKVTADGADMTVDVAAGYAHVFGHPYFNDGTVTLTVDASGGAVRYDAVVLRSDDDELAEADRLKLVIAKNVGNPPTLTQVAGGVWDEMLALIQVDAGVVVIASGKVLDRRRFLAKRIGMWTDDTQPDGEIGNLGFNFDLGLFEAWDPATSTYKPLAFGYENIVQSATPAVGPAGQLWVKPTT